MSGLANGRCLVGPRHVIAYDDPAYPDAVKQQRRPPQRLYLIGEPGALQEGLAIVGARKATPYGISCARHFAEMAASRGIVIVSGGARGCDAAAHEAALDAQGTTVVFLGGGCDMIYPAENAPLFQRVIDAGGAVVSEHEWSFKPKPYAFRERNRLIAGLARATLIVEAGLPSGTFSTADAALEANRDVLVVPGAITSAASRGANRLIYQGAVPIIDDETFEDQLFGIFGCLRSLPASGYAGCSQGGRRAVQSPVGDTAGLGDGAHVVGDAADAGADALLARGGDALLAALRAQSLSIDELHDVALRNTSICEDGSVAALMLWLAEAQRAGLVTQHRDGRFGALLATRTTSKRKDGA